jgi:vitamin B12 transporter
VEDNMDRRCNERSRRRFATTLVPLALAIVVALPTRGAAAAQQTGPPPGEDIFAGCEAAAGAKDEAAMNALAERAEALATSLATERRADALMIRAQILSRCRIPFANFMRQGSLVDESNELLEQALRLEPTHLGARFILGMNHYHTPAFLGRTDDAIDALSRLIEQHGAVADPRIATAYLVLGNLYERTGRSEDAARTWSAGARQFPDHMELRQKAGSREPVPVQDGAARHDLQPIVVEASGYSMDDTRTATRLTKLEVYTLPGGTADVLHAFQTMPGVTRVNDGADLYVRGGDVAESPMYVDGARLFHPGRFETLNGSVFGVLDPSAVRRAYFSSGGFSARYGNALSGIVDIETEGRPLERQWRVGANLTSLGGTLWQPLTSRTGVWGTAMATTTRPLLALHGRLDDYPESPRSLQGMAGIVFEPRRGVEVKATALLESDATTASVSAAGYDGAFRSAAATRLASAAIRLLSDDGRAGLRVAAGASVHESGFEFGVLDRDRTDRSATVRIDGDVARSRLHVRGGLELARMDARRDGVVPAGEELAPGSPVVVLDDEHDEARHMGVYGEVEARVSDRVALIAGVRTDALPGESSWTVDPRLAIAYALDAWTMRLGGGVFSQGRWRTRYALPDGGRPAGVPLRASHFVAGVQRDGSLALRAEAYIKRYSEFDARALGMDAVGEPGPSAIGGSARGIDVIVQWTGTERVTGWLTYSLIDAHVELEDGVRLPSEYDATHTATAVTKTAVGQAWEVGLTTRYGSGRPFTPIIGMAEPTAGRPVAPLYGAVHGERYPDYFRVDARITRLIPVRGGLMVAYLEALNVLDRANVVGYTYDADYRARRPIGSFFGDRTLVFGMELRF